jgi:hypothetical protein
LGVLWYFSGDFIWSTYKVFSLTILSVVFDRNSFSLYDPRVMVPTVVYLAGKVEECSVRLTLVMQCMRRLPDCKSTRSKLKHL